VKYRKSAATHLPVRRCLMARLTLALGTGGWWCTDCESQTERLEGEQGQPAACGRCGSYRISYQPPITA
jgi:hypothetical protein